METCGHVPIDVTNVIAKLILPDLREGHAPAFEGRMVLSGEDILTQPAGLDLYLPYFF